MKLNCYMLALLCLIPYFFSVDVIADGVVVDKVYHPYVLPNEREFEWRLISHQQDTSGKGYKSLAQRFAYGQSISETIMLEGYLVGERDELGDFSLSAYEIEMRWMLTEQGQYWSDWGLLFEIEKEHLVDNWELTSGVLMEKEFGRTSLTFNAFLVYEWGKTLRDEIEFEFRVKYRYRYLEQIQLAVELYSGEDYLGLGPAFMGVQRFNGQKQLKWEAAFITGLRSDNKDHILRVAIEYEF